MEKLDFNQGWTFSRLNSDQSIAVDLPHDAMIHEERSPDSPGGSANAFFPGGQYTYEKKIVVPADWQEKSICLLFEGVYQNSRIFINGQLAGGRPYGYLDFHVQIGHLLIPGQENMIRVEVDNLQLPNSRWYSGSGIYRPVSLLIGPAVAIEPDGIRLTTLSIAPARIRVETKTLGDDIRVVIRYLGQVVATGLGKDCELTIEDPKLWTAETPDLYECQVDLFHDGQLADQTIEQFGIRLISWSKQGLFINGQLTLLRGGCVHHDHGIVGACCYDEAEFRRVRILKKAGFNAIRSSHNPASRALLRACDQLGLYVIDETWDMWYIRKSKFDYANAFMDHYAEDVELLVRRNYNHPSVIMYSIGNELTEPYQEKGQELARELVIRFHKLDISRPVTGGINLMIINLASQGKGIYDEEKGGRKDQDKPQKTGSLFFNMLTAMVGASMNKSANSDSADRVTTPCLDALDIAGYNYAAGRYPLEGQKHPDRVIYGSETFPQSIAANWSMVKKYPYLIGDFMWTAWDYLGEAGIGGWSYRPEDAGFEKPYPWLTASTGAIDILGHIGAEAAFAAIVWGQAKKPYIGVRPVNHPGARLYKSTWRWTNAIDSWSWQNCEGNTAEIEIFADAYAVRLFLNGRKLGRKKIRDYQTRFKVRYTPGTLRVEALDQEGRIIGENELCSAIKPVRIVIQPERIAVNPGSIVYIDVSIQGGNGVVEANADTQLAVKTEGGQLLGFGSANPCTTERFDSGCYTAYFGRALAIVRAGDPGLMKITVTGDGLLTEAAEIEVLSPNTET